MRRVPALRSYRESRHAARALAALREAFPSHTFAIVDSPRAAYAFRKLIQVTTPDGKTAFVGKGPILAAVTVS